MMGAKLNYNDMREYTRGLVKTEVKVNDGCPYQGGILRDVSVGGAAVIYPNSTVPTSEPVVVGQDLTLMYLGDINLPGSVVRLFEGGFAVEFDYSIAH